jgi:large subunit ribosomal protein L9
MEVILKTDVAKLGHKDEIIDVKPGYGRNYLIPQGIAILATPSAKKVLAENMKQRAHKLEKIKQDAVELAAKMEGLNLTIGAKASTIGKIFGSVNTIQIAEALKNAGFDIDRKIILIKDEAIKDLGSYSATIKLHREVKVDITFDVVAE